MGARERGTVLIIEDEDDVRETYSLNLETEGFDVRTAANGGEGLVELCPDVDVVLLDRRMPGMSGDEVLDHICQWQSDCRVVMVTAVDPGPDIVDMEFDDYLTKPVSKDELVAAVEQLLLFNRYEDLITEYHSVVRKYAVLRSHLEQPSGEPGDDETVAELEDRRDDLREELSEIVEGFTDEDIASVFREMHAVH